MMIDIDPSEPLFPGKILSAPYKDGLTMRVVVIDPNGLGVGRPTLGMGFNMTGENLGLDKGTLSRWSDDAEWEGVANQAVQAPERFSDGLLRVLQNREWEGVANNPLKLLKTPSGKAFRVVQINDETGNTQLVIEGTDWVDLIDDVVEKPGKVRKFTIDKLNSFSRWLAKKGFYGTVYAACLPGGYTSADNAAVSNLIAENELLKTQLSEKNAQLEEAFNNLALVEYRFDRLQYDRDELAEIAHFNRHNCWGAETGGYDDEDGDEDESDRPAEEPIEIISLDDIYF